MQGGGVGAEESFFRQQQQDMNLGQTKSKESTSKSNNNKNLNCQDRFVAKSLSNFPPSGHSLVVDAPRRSRSQQSSCLSKCIAKGHCHCPSVTDVNDPGRQLFEQLLNKVGKVERLLVPDLATEWYRKQKVFIDQVTDAEMDYLRRRAERFEQRNPMRDNYDDAEMTNRRRSGNRCLISNYSQGKERKERNEEERKKDKEASQQFANPCTYLSCGCGKCQLQHSAQYQQLCRQQRRSRQYCRKLVRCKYLLPPKKPSKTELELERQQVPQEQQKPWYTVCETDHKSCAATERKSGGATASATPSYIRYEPVQPGPCRRKPSSCSYVYQADGQPMASECIAALQNKCNTLPRRNVRDSATSRRSRRPERFRRISPEFYKLWQGYEDGLTEKYPLYGKPIRLCPRAKPCCPCEEGSPCKIVMAPEEDSEEESQEEEQVQEVHEPKLAQEAEVERKAEVKQKKEKVKLKQKPEMLAVANPCNDRTCENMTCPSECPTNCLGCSPAHESHDPRGKPIYQVCKPDCPGPLDCPGANECQTLQVTRNEWMELPQRPCSRINREGDEEGCKDQLITQIKDRSFLEPRKPQDALEPKPSRRPQSLIVIQNFHDEETLQDHQRELRDRLMAKFYQKYPTDAAIKRATPKCHDQQDAPDQRGSLHDTPGAQNCQTEKEVRYSCLSVPSTERETRRRRGSSVTFDTRTYEVHQSPTTPKRGPPLLPKPVRPFTQQQQKLQPCPPAPPPRPPLTRRSSVDKSHGILGNLAMRCKRAFRPGRHLLYNFSKNYHKRNEPKAETSGGSKTSTQINEDCWTMQQEKQQQQEEVEEQGQQKGEQEQQLEMQQQQQAEQHQYLPLICNQQEVQYAVQSEPSKTLHEDGATLSLDDACQTLEAPQAQHIYPRNSAINQIHVASSPAPLKPASSTNIAPAQRRQQWVKHSPQLLRRKARLFASTNSTTNQGTKRSSARSRQNNLVTQSDGPQRIAANVKKTSPIPDEANLRRRNRKPKGALRLSYDEQRRDQLAQAVKFALALPQAKPDAKPIRRTLAFNQGTSNSSQLWHFANKPKFFSWKKRRWPVTPINSRQSMVSMSSLQAKIGADNDTSTDIMAKQEERLTNVTYFVHEERQQQGREHEDQRSETEPRRQKEIRAPPQEELGKKNDSRGQKDPRAPPQEEQREQKDQREQRYPQEKRDAGGSKEPREQEYYREQSDRRNQREKQRILTKEQPNHRDLSEKKVPPPEKKVPPPVAPRKPRQELSQVQQNTQDYTEQREIPRIQQDLRKQTSHGEQRYIPEQRVLHPEQLELFRKQTQMQRAQQDLRSQQGARDLSQELRNRQRDSRDQRDPRDHRDSRDQRDSRDPRDQRDSQDQRDSRDQGDPQVQREAQDIRLFMRDQQVTRQLPRSVSQVIQQKEQARKSELPPSNPPPTPAVILSSPSRTLMKSAQQVWQRLESTMGAQPPPPLLLVRSATPTPGQRRNSNRSANLSDDHINRTRSGCDLQFRDEPQNQRKQSNNPQGLERTVTFNPRPSTSVRNLRSTSEVPTTSRAAYQVVQGLDQTKPQITQRSVALPRGSNVFYSQLLPSNQVTIETATAGGGARASPLEQRPLPLLSMQRSSNATPASNLPGYSESYGYPPAAPKNSINSPMPQRPPGSILKTTPKPVQHPVKHVNFVRERGGSVPPTRCVVDYQKRHPESSILTSPMPECCRALKAAKKTQPSLFAVATVNSLDEEQEEEPKEQPFQLRYSHDRLPRYVKKGYVRGEGEPLPPNAPLLTVPEFDEQQLPVNAQLMLNEDDYRPLRKANERYMAPPVAMVSELEFGTFFQQSRDFNLPEERQRDVDPPELMTKLMNTLRVRHHGLKLQSKEDSDTPNTFIVNNDAFYIGSGTGKAGAGTAAATAARLENEKTWRNWMHERNPPRAPSMNLMCGERGKDKNYLPRRRCNLRRLPDNPVVIAPTHSGLCQQQVLQKCLPVLFYDRRDAGAPR